MSLIGVPLKELADEARKLIPEGLVLLKNENMCLPIQKTDNVAIFGRCQIDLYRSGTGSGGSVNVEYTTNLIDGLLENNINIDKELLKLYKEWIKDNPYDNGGGTWASDPWNQKEYVISKDICSYYSKRNNKAIIVIGRTAGEDKDYSNQQGSYLLSEDEKTLIDNVTTSFNDVIVLLNVSNIIDMSYFCFNPAIKSIMYVWQGGIVGGLAIGDALSGRVSPSGKLTDTIAKSIDKYPSDKYFYDKNQQFYVEDIYVGYRFFNTFKKDDILFPFGFGLTYTTFKQIILDARVNNDDIEFSVLLENIGDYPAKEVIEVYLEAANGLLGRPSRELLTFAKSNTLKPNQKQIIEFKLNVKDFKTYDDSGVTGYPNSYVVEKGYYKLYVGNSSLDNKKINFENDIFVSETILVEKCHSSSKPVAPFKRFKRDENCQLSYEDVPLNDVNLAKRINSNLPLEIPYIGDCGIKLIDVKNKKHTIDEFIAQLSDENLTRIVRGEGMCSPKVTPGVASCFGGITDELAIKYGIPICATSDGPSGIRMDVGFKATQIPIGTLIASSWNVDAVEDLFYYEGLEVKRNEIDSLLGPGINIHRHPLNGRNFEYMSEDPLLTGKIASAEIRGLKKAGVLATIKHLCCNNKETNRYYSDSIVSERALREIYLKAFEICVKEGNAKSIMTSYNLINGFYGQVCYDIITTILRNEWHFNGIVMTDWWALNNDVVNRGQVTKYDLRSMIKAQNDLYMVVDNYGAMDNINNDNLLESLENGLLTRAELQRSVKNILLFILESEAMNKDNLNVGIKSIASNNVKKGQKLDFGTYKVYAKISMKGTQTAQGCTNVFLNNQYIGSAMSNGTNGEIVSKMIGRVSLTSGYYDITYFETKKGITMVDLLFVKD